MADPRPEMFDTGSPLLESKAYAEPSVFTPEALRREARRQGGLPERDVPGICLLDPDGDIVEYLRSVGAAEVDSAWPGYHTDLYRFSRNEIEFGIVPHAVGAPFATLVAEQLFAAGCRLLLSMTSAGQIRAVDEPPYFVVIDRALRDEGTSHHYARPDRWAAADESLRRTVEAAVDDPPQPVYIGPSWTTDAPFRETRSAIDRAESEGILAVEMEAAGLYTFARTRDRPVLCFAHVTNRMGQVEKDFEKGEHAGAAAAVSLLATAAAAWSG